MNDEILKMEVRKAARAGLNTAVKNQRHGYEWEKSLTKKEDEKIIKGHILRLQAEVKRMTDNLRRGGFSRDDEKIHVERLKQKNSELAYWEEKDRQSRR